MSATPFAGLRPPGAPPELGRRILAEAASRAHRGSRTIHPLDRFWESPAARWAWLGTMILLVAALFARAPTTTEGPSLGEFFEEVGIAIPGAGTSPAEQRILLVTRLETELGGEE